MNRKNFIENFYYSESINSIPALVLGSHKIGLGSIRALGIKGVPVISAYYNPNDMGMVSKYVTKKFHITNPLVDESKFLDDILFISKKTGKSVLFASDDPTLVAVSKNKHLLSDKFYVEAPDYEILDIIISKEKTYDLAESISIRVPKTFNPKNLEEAIEFFESMNKPCLLKPSVSHLFFSIFKEKMLFVNDRHQLEKIYQMVQKYNLKMMVQEFIPGEDTNGINYNTFAVNGIPVIEFTADKQRLSPQRIGFPVVIKSERVEGVIEPGRKLLKALNFTGFSCMEFKKHSLTNEFILMEVNGRQNLSSLLAVKSGLNFPYITYRYLIDNSLPVITGDYKKNIYWIDSGKDMLEYFPKIILMKYSLMKFIKPYLHSKIHSIADINDPLPFLKRLMDALRIIVRKLIFTKNKESN